MDWLYACLIGATHRGLAGLRRGDHICAPFPTVGGRRSGARWWRNWREYHHGIIVQESSGEEDSAMGIAVIDLDGDRPESVRRVDLYDSVINGEPKKGFTAPATSIFKVWHMRSAQREPSEIAAKAEQAFAAFCAYHLAGGQTPAPYDFVRFNCESFATWCVIGRPHTWQVVRGVIQGFNLLTALVLVVGFALVGGLHGFSRTGIICYCVFLGAAILVILGRLEQIFSVVWRLTHEFFLVRAVLIPTNKFDEGVIQSVSGEAGNPPVCLPFGLIAVILGGAVLFLFMALGMALLIALGTFNI